MQASIKDLTIQNIKDIPEPCRACLYWEKPAFEGKNTKTEKKEHEKAAWFAKTLKEFGNCGKILYVDNMPVGYAQYSTCNRLPKVQDYGAEKLDKAIEKVAFISCLYISKENFRGKRLGVKLLNEVIDDLKKRGFEAVETFARKGSTNNPSGPIEIYLKKGFSVKEDIDSDFALMRRDI
ncbi:MAG: N-acetyltransferase family protein [Candidatus Bathyarchaeia archaeon]